MAPKRDRANASANNDDAMTYFIGMVCQWKPTNASLSSFNELIRDAHEWGEMRVRAEIYAMQLRDVPASKRLNMLTTTSDAWYAAGYRMYLLPNSGDSPDALRHRPRTNASLMAQSELSRRELPPVAARIWRQKYASTILGEAQAAVEAERRPTTSPAQSSASPATAPLRTRALLARLPATPPPPPRPPTLERFLAQPGEKVASAPREGIEAAVAAAICNQHALRAWDGALVHHHKPAYAMQMELHARNLLAVYGCGNEQLCKDAMRRNGLQKIAGGAYNTVWTVGEHGAPWATELFGREVGEAFLAKRLVLRAPRTKAGWLTFDEAVGEASNMLFTALCGCGPRVALLLYASHMFDDADAHEEGLRVPKYRLAVLLERATLSVDKRYAPETPTVDSAATSDSYLQALLTCVYQFSHEGFVHLDGTLRNLVDCYPRQLLNHRVVEWCVKVIDVDKKTFRRLCPAASAGWRDLFLVNLLVVFTFLKLRLGERWNKQRHWSPVARGVEQLLRELPGRAVLPAIAFWEGPYNPDEKFDEEDPPAYVACTHKSSALFLLRQMRYYLLRQPLEQCDAKYVDVRLSGRATPAELEKAQTWYDNDYRRDVYPAHCYFRDALQPRANGKPRLFATVLYGFLVKSHEELCTEHADKLAPSQAHMVFGGLVPREQMLGVHCVRG